MSTVKRAQEARALQTPRTISSGQALTLWDWLEVSWFFPDNFRKERTVERPDCYLVYGANEIYKFYRSESDFLTKLFGQHRSTETTSERWKRACDEITDHRRLAPGLYVGLRAFKWVDDEPEWLSETPLQLFERTAVPAEADDVAVVLRRYPEQSSLLEQLLSEDIAQDRLARRTAETLTRFHRRLKKPAREKFLSTKTDEYLALKEEIDSLEEFIRGFADYLDPVSRLALRESHAFAGTFLERSEGQFSARGGRGLVVNGHGALRAESIFLSPLNSESVLVSYTERLPRGDKRRRLDVLADLASLVLDLEARDLQLAARKLERFYFRAYPSARDPELYRFFTALTALRRVRELLLSLEPGSAISAPISDPLDEVGKLLSSALRAALKLPPVFVAALSGIPQAESIALARGVSELAHMSFVDEDSVSSSIPVYDEPAHVTFTKMIDIVERNVEQGRSSVMVFPFAHAEEVESFLQMAERANVASLFVVYEGNFETSSARPFSFGRRDGGEIFTPLFIRPELPLAEMGLYILRELAIRSVSFSRTSKHR